MSERVKGPVAPRLMTAAQAANYLGYKSVEILRQFPVWPIPIGRGKRWDRAHLDEYLDSLSGLTRGRGDSSESEVIDEIERHFR